MGVPLLAPEQQEQRHRDLLGESDVHLFMHGACAIFAIALHDVLGHPIAWLPGHPECAIDGIPGVSHAVGFISEGVGYGVDVAGTRNLELIRRQYGGTEWREASSEDLGRWRTDSRHGVYGAEWFWSSAMARARSRIARYREFYAGGNPECTPPDAIGWLDPTAAQRYR